MRNGWKVVGIIVSGVAIGLVGGCANDPAAKEAVNPPLAAWPAIEPGPSSREVIAEAKAHLGRDDIAAAVRVLNSLHLARRSAALRELDADLALEPVRAARFALAWPAGTWRNATLEGAIRRMVERDADAAVRWVMTLPEPMERYEASRALAARILEADPATTLQRLMEFPVTVERDELIRLTAAGWAGRDTVKAVAWARGLPVGDFKTSVLTSMAFQIAQTEPGRALEMAGELPAGLGRRRVYATIGQTWVARDSTAAWTWARGLPEGELRDAAVAGIEAGLGFGRSSGSSITLGSSSREPFAPSSLAGLLRDPVSLPLGTDRDRELRRKFEELLLLSPTMAANWVSVLPIPDRKDEMVDRVAREWLMSNPAMAESWMDQNMVTPTRREELLRAAGLWPPSFPPVP